MTVTNARIAVVTDPVGGAVQELLAAMVVDWRASGTKVVGVIAESHGIDGRTCGAGFLRDIASGKTYSMFRETVSDSAACHIDAGGVDAACKAVVEQIPASDLVVLSKFGNLEARRKGLAPALEAAIAAGKPVLTTVSEKHRCALESLAQADIDLVADGAALQAWWKRAVTAEV